MRKYIAKPDTWFDEGTEVFLYEDTICGTYPEQVLAKGIHNGDIDEELCLMDEFEICE